MPLAESIIVGQDGTAPPGLGLPLRVAVVPSALGPALVTNASFTGTLEVNLDLANDEVCIGTETAGSPPGTRALNQGRTDGANNVPETVPRLVGVQTSTLGKAIDTAVGAADVGVPPLLVKRIAPASGVADGDYMPATGDDVGATWIRERKPDTVPLGTAVNVALVQISLGAANADRFTVTFFNNGTNTVYIGPTGVLVANGMPLLRGASITLEATIEWFAIAAVAGPTEVRVLEQSY